MRAATRARPSAITKRERSWKVAPATETIPSLPARSNGIGSGNTYAERGKATARMFSIANAIATVAATQPSVDPRTRYWWMTAK